MGLTSTHNLSPFIPSDSRLEKAGLPDKAIKLISNDAQLAGHLAPETAATLRRHMAVLNSYYSNLIEGNRTLPAEIRAAQRGDYSNDPAKRDLQAESVAHIKAQEWLIAQSPNVDRLFSPEFIAEIHHQFYLNVPKNLWHLRNQQGDVVDTLKPGAWRDKDVTVGQHHPPATHDIPSLISRFCEIYHPNRYSGDRKLIAVLSAHHRLLWIHPFTDGNGRVARLFIDTALRSIGLTGYGIWNISRGLARHTSAYKNALSRADAIRQGNQDGRGLLSEAALTEFCEFLLDTALDQVNYIGQILELNGMRDRINRYIAARNDGRVQGMGPVKESAKYLLFHTFVTGKLERQEATGLIGMSERSARRLLQQLKAEGLLSETSPRSPLYWQIPEHAEPWYFPQLSPQGPQM